MISAFAALAFLCPQSTWHVDAMGTAPGTGTVSDPYTRVDYALAQPGVLSGDTVVVAPGVYQGEVVDFLGKDVHVTTSGATLQSTYQFPAPPPLVTFSSGESASAILEGFQMVGGGFADFGSQRGGTCVLIQGASPTLRNCTFTQDPNIPQGACTSGGGVYIDNQGIPNSEVLLDGCDFVQCVASTQGGAIYIDNAFVRFDQCNFTGSGSYSVGGGLYANESDVIISDSSFTNNSIIQVMFGLGGQAAFEFSRVLIEDCQFEQINAGHGSGGLYIRESNAVLRESEFVGHEFSSHGVAVRSGRSHLEVSQCQFLDNRWGADAEIYGAGIFNDSGTLVVSDCLFDGNVALNGGAIGSWGGVTEVSDSVFTGNSTFSASPFIRGGALYLQGEFQVRRSQFTDNQVTGIMYLSQVFSGGAVHAEGVGSIEHCSFEGNSVQVGEAGFDAEAKGGAIWASAGVTVDHCEFRDNFVDGGMDVTTDGGALYGPMVATHCTLLRSSSAPMGSQAMAGGGSLRNSIVWETNGPVLDATVMVDYSIVQGGASGLGNLDVDPALWGMDDVHLLPHSPAIDSGDPSSPLDADGSRADMGAFPFSPYYCGPGCAGTIGTVTCLSTPNSTGGPATLEAVGSEAVADNVLILHTSDLPTGMLAFYLGSNNLDFVPGFGGSQGVLCLGPPRILRFNAHAGPTSAIGTFTQVHDLAQFPLNTTVQPGESWYFQLWHRDVVSGVSTSNTSPAVRVDFD